MRSLTMMTLSNVYVGLLTHTAQDAVQESSITAAVSEKCGDKGRPVIVIAKNRLFEEETFPEALRMILYAEELEVFRSHAVASLKKACDASVIFLNKVERYALMATFEAARREGVYETDNAIRMASLPAKRVLEKKLREEEFLVESLEKLRNAAGIELYLKSGQRPGELDKLAWSERFDDKEHLSSLAMPIEVGDVFRFYNQVSKSGDDKYFILLAQPCDVSVRADGKRSNDLDSFVLTQITPAAFDKRSGEYKGVKHGQKDIGCLLPDSDVPWRVSFSKQIRVPALALDACAVSGDGRSVIGPNVCPSSKLPSSWMRRFERMKQESGKIIERFRAMNKAMVPVEDMKREAADAKKQLAASLAGAGVTHSKGVTATIDLGESVVVYGVERYARVTERTASGLLLLLSNHHARPAFEGDLFHDI